MKLSEAITHGSTLRPESHQERFCEVVNRGLCSDAWGAACEAVYPRVAMLNWDPRDRFKFEMSMETLRGIQQRYFKSYWMMPARCPGAHQRFVEAGGRVINSKGEVALNGAKEGDLGGITSECDRVHNMAGMVDHLFYAHGWSRLQIAEAVKWYEDTRSMSQLIRNFQHYKVN